jgi:ribonuclease BN (tRNA processing enzyme)
MAKDAAMHVEFLGTAGYHPNETRHTSCVYLPDAAPEHAFVLDAGTGFFRLIGRRLPPHLHIFLSHAHLDHVAGLTYLLNVLSKQQCQVMVYGTDNCLDTICNRLFDSPLFPLPFNQQTCVVEPGESFAVGGVRGSTFPLTHPGGSLAYRFDWPDRSLAYVTDTAGNGPYIDFIREVDLLIHERNFSDDMHELADISGHCTSEAVVRVAVAANVRRLAITHFNPLTSIDPMEEDSLRAQCPEAVSAVDGLTLEF